MGKSDSKYYDFICKIYVMLSGNFYIQFCCRGGRLKEIRIRTQARKFLFLWIQKTYGKVTLSQAKTFYEKKIIAKCLKYWKDYWWETCGEMKLYIRAEYFNR